ncbi:MAG: DUF3987 domain-containing protein [Methylobacter sp.]
MINHPQYITGKKLIHWWPYHDADGNVIGSVARYQDGSGKKEILPFFKRDGESWVAGIDLNPRPLFGLDKLAAQPKDRLVFIVEGEKCAAALQSIGVCAISSLGGSQAAKLADWTPLNGYKTVYLLPDADAPGEHYAQDAYRALMALESPPDVTVVVLSDLPVAGDVVDWIRGKVSDWNGYAPINASLHDGLKKNLLAELKNAKPVPDNWNLAVLAGAGCGVFGWEKPCEIETKTPPVQALTAELIPEPFRPWLADVSHRMQTPTDFAGISSIVIVGSIIGAGCGIRPKCLDDWEVIPNVWGAAIGRPSVVLKSPSMKEPMSLLERLQAEYGEKFEQDMVGAEFDSLANKARIDEVKGKLSKAAKGVGKDRDVTPDNLQELKAEYMELSESAKPEPTRRLFKMNETSIQSMTVLQNQNSRGLLTFRDELTALLVKWDREDGADERAYFLEGWNGNGSYTDFKIGRGLTEASNICVSLLGGIQPDKLKRYLYQAQNGANDGLMQRLQLAVWPDEPQHWELIDTKPDKTEKQRAYEIMKTLARLDFTQCGAVQGEYDDRPYFRFENDAQEIFNEWLTELQTVKIQQETNPLMVEHFGKFRSLMPSLALIFHCIDIADGKTRGTVSAQAAKLAVDWCGYLESHARRIYAMAESPEHEAAVRLAEKIKAKAIPSPFTSKAIYDKGWHGLKNRQEVEAACNALIDENYLMKEQKPSTGGRGRPPLPEFHINPFFL